MGVVIKGMHVTVISSLPAMKGLAFSLSTSIMNSFNCHLSGFIRKLSADQWTSEFRLKENIRHIEKDCWDIGKY